MEDPFAGTHISFAEQLQAQLQTQLPRPSHEDQLLALHAFTSKTSNFVSIHFIILILFILSSKLYASYYRVHARTSLIAIPVVRLFPHNEKQSHENHTAN
jgi:hypothetical protein